MSTQALGEFIAMHRDDLILRCRRKVLTRCGSTPIEAHIDRGIPLFLDDLVGEFAGPSRKREMNDSATQRGADLFFDGSTVEEVVHSYGSVCQSVTELALEVGVAITVDDFRTLNRCLDDAIACAVAEHAQQERLAEDGRTLHRHVPMRNLLETAIAGFEALRSGTVGVTGATGDLVHRSLLALRPLVR